MFTWKKINQIFDPTSPDSAEWMQEFAQSPSTIEFPDFLRVYFTSREVPDDKGMYVSRMGYVDLDKKDLTHIIAVSHKPILPLGEKGCFDEHGTYPVSVIRDEDKLKVYYAGWSRCESVPFNAAIGLAVSEDNGDTFLPIGKGPILSYSPDEPFVLGSPKIRKYNNTWYLWYASGKRWMKTESKPEPTYKIRCATSSDGINWVKMNKDLIPDVIDENECQASPDVFFHNGKYHMFFSYRQHLEFKEDGKGYQVGYASSDDLISWTRNDSIAGFFPSKNKQSWDSDSISYVHLFELNQCIYALYQGKQMGRFGFGLAKLESYSEQHY